MWKVIGERIEGNINGRWWRTRGGAIDSGTFFFSEVMQERVFDRVGEKDEWLQLS